MADMQGLLAKAEAGDVSAQYTVGNAYHLGLGVPKNLPLAMRWYLKAAAQGHVDAQVNLGIVFINDLGTAGGTRNPAQARYWFRRAAELGDAQAMAYLARIYLDGDGVPASPARACDWLQRAGEQGYVDAFNELGVLLDSGHLGEPDHAGAAAAYDRGARLGDMRAQHNLANCYLAGRGVDRNAALAMEWYRAAADQGLGDAQHKLAALLASGVEGAEPDPRQALQWLAKAADKGVAQAQYELAKQLRVGEGIAADPLQAMHYYHEAADRDHADAMFSLALMLEVGAGLDRPYPERAAGWYRRLAQRHAHGGAAHNLGILHAQGSGVPKDVAMAQELFELAISLGADEAMHSLALLLVRGDGLPADIVEGAKWAILAQRDDPRGDARKLFDVIAALLPPELMAQAQARAESWQRSPKTVQWNLQFAETADR
jgi:TPR repeat protein